MIADLVFRDCVLLDGSGKESTRGDLAVAGDRIVAIGSGIEEGRKEIPCGGRCLAPGFIDVHSHDDFEAFLRPELSHKILQGVTTVVVGNCGIGAAPFPGAEDWYAKLHPEEELPKYANYQGYFCALEEAQPCCNVAAFAGHGALRRAAAPDSRAPLSPREKVQAIEVLGEALEAGVLGMSAGLIYEPGVHSDEEELVQLLHECRERAPLFAIHLRSEADDLLPAVEEALRLGERAGVGVQLSHHKAHGRNNWGRVTESLALVEAARERGQDVWLDQYPYAAGSTILSAVLERGGLRGGAALGKLLPEDIVIASCEDANLNGKSLGDLAKAFGVSPEKAGERVLAIDAGTWVVVHAMAESDVEKVMRHEATMIGSDGLPTKSGRPHPRLFGTFPRVLGHYSRRRGLFSLESAVRKMTSLPASRFALAERGRLKEGAFADLVLFDSERIEDAATYEDPRNPPRGISGVWVNGARVVEEGRLTGKRPGRALRRETSPRPS